MGSSPLTLKAGVSDFCNIVCQGFPGQHARTVFVTPSGCLAAAWGQDGACPSPDTPFGSLAPPCPRLPPCIPGGQALAGAWEGAGRVVGEVRPARTLPPASPSPECLWFPISGSSSFQPIPGAVGSSWGHLGLAQAPGRVPRTPHLIRKQLAVPATPLGLSRLPWPCPRVACHTRG